ncbi:hypothetical protein CEXT_153931 [Caerostris extrusa]|uniref:Secreted protein n=1 Tax=Caerostris extrusa TaxID=172846 RepID=A0AAV4W7N8_CAEEX|nr:hypothetical protein CEXT_153931 [Caerostris extrusa]
MTSYICPILLSLTTRIILSEGKHVNFTWDVHSQVSVRMEKIRKLHSNESLERAENYRSADDCSLFVPHRLSTRAAVSDT